MTCQPVWPPRGRLTRSSTGFSHFGVYPGSFHISEQRTCLPLVYLCHVCSQRDAGPASTRVIQTEGHRLARAARPPVSPPSSEIPSRVWEQAEHIPGPPIPLSASLCFFSCYLGTSDKTERESVGVASVANSYFLAWRYMSLHCNYSCNLIYVFNVHLYICYIYN